MHRSILAALLVALLAASSASATPTAWNTDEDFAPDRALLKSDGTPATVTVKRGDVLYWGPRAGSEDSPAFEVLDGVAVLCVWRPDTVTGSDSGATLDLKVGSGSLNGTDANEWGGWWPEIPGTACAPGIDKCTAFSIEWPGVWKLTPSAQAANGRVKCSAKEAR